MDAISKNTSHGTSILPSLMKRRAQEIAHSFDAHHGEIEWEQAAVARDTFALSKAISTKMLSERLRAPGQNNYKGATFCRGTNAASVIAQQESEAALQGLSSLFDKALSSSDEFVASVVKTNGGEIEMPPRRVVSFHYLGCHDCRQQGHVTCRVCSGEGKHSCPNFGCNWGKQTCHTCNGSRGHQHYDAGNRRYTWINCGGCFGSGVTVCFNCNGACSVLCTGCGGRGDVQCQPCRATGYFTERCEVFGQTKITDHGPATKPPKQSGILWRRWAEAGFPRANETAESGQVAYQIKELACQSAGTASFEIHFSGNAEIATLQGRMDSTPLVATGLRLDRPHFRFSPFLAAKAKSLGQTAFCSNLAPSAIADRVKNSAMLSTVIAGFAQSEAAGQATVSKIADEAEGAIAATDLMPFAAAYVQAKQTFSKQIWDQARNKCLSLIAAIAGGFALLDVPALLEKTLRGGRDPELVLFSFTVLGMTIAAIVTLTHASVHKRVEAEMGQGARLSEECRPGRLKFIGGAVFAAVAAAHLALSARTENKAVASLTQPRALQAPAQRPALPVLPQDAAQPHTRPVNTTPRP